VLQEEADEPGNVVDKGDRVQEATGPDGFQGLDVRCTPPVPQEKVDELRHDLPALRLRARAGAAPELEALGVCQLLRLLWLCVWVKVVGLLEPVWPIGGSVISASKLRAKAKLRAEAKEFVPLQVARVVVEDIILLLAHPTNPRPPLKTPPPSPPPKLPHTPNPPTHSIQPAHTPTRLCNRHKKPLHSPHIVYPIQSNPYPYEFTSIQQIHAKFRDCMLVFCVS
jgi:hypothetical protein